MSAQQSHPAAELLQELADEAMVNPEPWKAFEYKRIDKHSDGNWHQDDSMLDIVDSIVDENIEVRRRPKTVRVSGEVPEEVIDAARSVVGGTGPMPVICRALLSLVEESKP